MNKEQELGGFLNEVKNVVKSFNTQVEDQKRGFIILAVEENADGEGGESVIAVGGNGRMVTRVLGQFLTNTQTRPIVEQSLATAAIEKFAEFVAKKADKEETEEGTQEAGTKEEEQPAK